MKLTQEQKSIVMHEASCTVLGAPGTGKTTTLIEKAAHLIEKGVPPQKIYVVCFSYRSMLVMEEMLKKRFGKEGEQIPVATMRDFALQAMQKQDENFPDLIDNTTVRRLLRRAMREAGFDGTVQEAEHVMRQFKARGRKPSEDEPHHELFRVYKEMLENLNKIDRFDVVRKHIIGMRNDIYQPADVQVLLVDNVQDATQIQLLWLVDHMKAGSRMYAFGDDDLCLFAMDGAVGKEAFTDLEDLNDMPRLILEQNFRSAKLLGQAMGAVSKKLSNRLTKKAASVSEEQGVLEAFPSQNIDMELQALVKRVKAILEREPKASIGVITRHHLQARRVERLLKRAEIPHTSFARSIWETPGAILVLDLLEVLLNRSNDAKLKNLFTGYGLTRQAIDTLFNNGLVADDWLKNGAPLPKGLDTELPNAVLRNIGLLQRRLLGYYKVMREAGPKEVYKAAAYDMLQNLSDEDRTDALHALDELLSLEGKLTQMLDQIREIPLPDPQQRVVVAPVREVRNMEFDYVFMPMSSNRSYPLQYKVLGKDEKGERRMFFAAMSRARKGITFSWCGEPTTYFRDVEPLIPQHAA